jgi:hypothetical protein
VTSGDVEGDRAEERACYTWKRCAVICGFSVLMIQSIAVLRIRSLVFRYIMAARMLVSHETQQAAQHACVCVCVCVCVLVLQSKTDNTFHCARARENDRPPPEAGPQRDSREWVSREQRLRRSAGLVGPCASIIFAPSTLASRTRLQRRLVRGSYSGATPASTAVPLAWVPKNSKLLWQRCGGLGGICGILQIGR